MLGVHINRSTVKLVLDVLVWTLATPLAFLIGYDGAIPPQLYTTLAFLSGTALVIKLAAFFVFGLYRQSWHKLGFGDLSVILRAVVAVTLITSSGLFLLGGTLQVSRAVPLLDGLLSLLFLFGVRAAARYLYERRHQRVDRRSPHKRVLIVGAGEAGSLVAREMLRHAKLGLKPVGFVDDDPHKQRQRIATVPVLGSVAELGALVKKHFIDEVLIAIPSAEGKDIRRIVSQSVADKVQLRIVPGLYELISGKVSISRFREVEVEDLLRRPPIILDTASIAGYLRGKTVMVTGAGGSIGSELVRQICRFHPGRLVLFGRGENSIYALERELDRLWPEISYRSVIGNVRDKERLNTIFKRHKPDIVFHAAAHKHVPLMEHNPEEAVLNNVIGTNNLVDAALRYGVSHFVNISTDKAVNPTSVMGASKRVAEHIVHNASKAATSQQFVSVRFGNVLGSRGSVIPLFSKQIQQGGPITVTHPDMVRYFMTIPEASQLVLQAAGLGKNGEVYILDMGEPVKIVDLARDLIRLSGFEPDVDIEVEFTGLRPGEKLFEELMTEEEKEAATSHQKIFVAKQPDVGEENLRRTLERLQEAALEADGVRIREVLDEFIEGCHFQYAESF